MTLRFHALILMTVIAATTAVGFASAAIITDQQPAAKSDRLPVVAQAGDAGAYVTIETRHDGVSVLKRVPLD